jgi:hypothetical protein
MLEVLKAKNDLIDKAKKAGITTKMEFNIEPNIEERMKRLWPLFLFGILELDENSMSQKTKLHRPGEKP